MNEAKAAEDSEYLSKTLFWATIGLDQRERRLEKALECLGMKKREWEVLMIHKRKLDKMAHPFTRREEVEKAVAQHILSYGVSYQERMALEMMARIEGVGED
jgi:hypothetical protein